MSTVASKLCSFYNLRNRHILRPKFFGWIATCHYSADGKNTQYVLSDDNERKLVRVILDERKARVKERHRILQGIVQEKKEGFKESSQLLHGVLQDGKERIKESGQLLQGALQDGKERIKESGQLLQGALQDGKERIKERGQLLQGTLQDRKERIKERGQILQGALQERKERLKESSQILQGALQERKERLKESSQMLQGVLQQKKERFKESSQVLLEDIKETRNKMKEKVEEVIERENVLTIPNLLCVSRIIMSPVLGYLVIQADFHLALGVFVLAGISDLLDGWIARTFKNQASKMGSFLDPMADKVLIATLFLSLTYMDLIPVVLTGGIITRDLVLVAAGFYVRYKSLPPPRTLSRYFDVTHATAQLTPTFISKCNTGVQLLLVASTLAAPVFSYVDHPALHAMWYITAGTTVASAISYLISKNTYKFLRPQKK